MHTASAPVSPAESTVPRLVFRDLRTLDEVRAAAALRYRVYAATEGAAKCSSLNTQVHLDLDGFDLASRHFGLFEDAASGPELVGTMRVATGAPSPQAPLVRALAATVPALVKALARAPEPEMLPLLSYLGQSGLVASRLGALRTRGERIAEPGRFTLQPQLRRAALRYGVRLSEFMLLASQAAGWFDMQLDRVFITCDERLAPLYRSFGFGDMPGTRTEANAELGISITILEATRQSLPAPLHPIVRAFADALAREGEIPLDAFARAHAFADAA